MNHYVLPERMRVFHWYVWPSYMQFNTMHCRHVWTLNPNSDEAVSKFYCENASKYLSGVWFVFSEELNCGQCMTFKGGILQ